MPGYDHKLLIVVPAALAPAANAAVKAITHRNEDLQTFTVGLSPTGNAPPTHYWCAPVMRATHYAQVKALQTGSFPSVHIFDWDMDADPGLPQRVLTQLGLQVVGSVDG